MPAPHHGGMKYAFFVLSLPAVALLAACGGGGSTASNMPPALPVAPNASAPAPASTASANVPLATATFAATASFGSLTGFVSGTSSNARAVYVFDNDPVNTTSSTCSIASGCAAAWPSVPVPAGMTLVAPWSSITGTNGQPQLTVSGRPLYTFAGDGFGTDAGNGLTSFSVNNTPVWHLETPSGPAPNPGSVSTTALPTLPGY